MVLSSPLTGGPVPVYLEDLFAAGVAAWLQKTVRFQPAVSQQTACDARHTLTQ